MFIKTRFKQLMNFIIRMLSHTKKNITKFFKWVVFVKKNYSQSIPIYTKDESSGLKIHLGAGEVNLQGWINIDARKFTHIHLVSDGFDLSGFKDASIDEVYTSHVLEHFSFEESEKFIEKIYNILRPGGLFRISVPDIEKLLDLYKEQKKLGIIKKAIMGGQNYPNDFHKSIYDFNELKIILEKNNFKNIKSWNTEIVFGQSIGDWSDGYYKHNGKKFDISLNLVAQK